MRPNKRRLIPFLIIVLALLLTVTWVVYKDVETPTEESPTAEIIPIASSTAGATPSPLTPVPSLKIQLAWFYKPPADNLLPTLSQNFDFFILTHKDEPDRDTLRSLGVTAPIFEYLLLTDIRDPGNCTDIPFGNQAAFHVGDFCMIDTEHPDWFLLDQGERRITDGQVYFMDPGNPGYRAFWLERAQELQEEYGWSGIFIDNVDASLGRFKSMGVLPKNYPTEAQYQAAMQGFLDYLRANYFVPAHRKMYANITVVHDYDIWQDYLNSLDGVLVENFATGWSGRNKSRTEWEEQMNALEKAQDQGKTTILVAQGEQNNVKREKFSLASYLLIANEHSYFRYALSRDYDKVWLYENYQINLGPPLSTRYREGTVWRRDFLHGYVTVNPATLEAKIVTQ